MLFNETAVCRNPRDLVLLEPPSLVGVRFKIESVESALSLWLLHRIEKIQLTPGAQEHLSEVAHNYRWSSLEDQTAREFNFRIRSSIYIPRSRPPFRQQLLPPKSEVAAWSRVIEGIENFCDCRCAIPDCSACLQATRKIS